MNLFVVADNPAIFQGVILALSRIAWCDISAINGSTNFLWAMDYIAKGDQVDLAVLDLYLCGAPRGIEVAQAIKDRFPKASIIFFTRHVVEAKHAAVLDKVSVDAFIDKSLRDSTGQLVAAVRRILNGKSEEGR